MNTEGLMPIQEWGSDEKWSKDWSLEEFRAIWQSGHYRKYCKKRKDTNEMVAYYIEKYGEVVPEGIDLVRTTQITEKRNTLGNSWYPLPPSGEDLSRAFMYHSKHSELVFSYNSSWLRGKKGIHFDETRRYEEEWLLNPSDLYSYFIGRYYFDEVFSEVA